MRVLRKGILFSGVDGGCNRIRRGGALSPPGFPGAMKVSTGSCRGRPMCRPVGVFWAGACPGGHIGPPLRGGGGVPNQRKIGAKTGPCLRGGTEPAPYRRQEQNGCGGVRLGCGFRRPNFVPKFGASVMGIGPYALWGTARRGRRALRVGAGGFINCRGSALSTERGAGQIRFLPDNLRVQHGVPCPEVCGKPRPCPRRDYLN